jgi:hypothetical protein
MKVFSRYYKDICYNVIQEVHESYSSFPGIEAHQVGDKGSITKESDSAETQCNCPHLIYLQMKEFQDARKFDNTLCS